KMKEFERDYLTQLKTRFPQVLKGLNKPMSEETEKQLKDLAAEVSLTFY
ncbi:MAG: hypothetical protein JST49_06445, partial [Bacteroidetes bacterium]|nr:hypothetical protein [Bacteroidota bacterium]